MPHYVPTLAPLCHWCTFSVSWTCLGHHLISQELVEHNISLTLIRLWLLISWTGDEELDVTADARAVHFAQDMTVHIELQEDSRDGRIYPPYLRINYGHALTEDRDVDKTVKVRTKFCTTSSKAGDKVHSGRKEWPVVMQS